MGRFALATHDDYSAYGWIAALISLTYTTLTIFLRIYLKYGTFGLEDLSIAAAQVFAYANFAANAAALTNGLGKRFSTLDLQQQHAISRV